jgi:LacI family repressor for deo operon, udp, cdd, tsx, nupC, and nupG
MKETMTIQDVARNAGVSVATVSRVLNNSPLVKEQTRAKIMKVIKEMEYEPNFLGRELRRAETRRIMVLTPSLVFPIMAGVYKGMQEAAQQHGYNVLVCSTAGRRDKEEELLQMLKTRIVDGVILLTTTLHADELNQLAKVYRVVQCSEFKQDAEAYCVTIDNEQAAYDAAAHLIAQGHRRIAMLRGRHESSAMLREQGYRRALEHAGLAVDAELIHQCNYDYESGYASGKQLMATVQPPTAIFCANDVVAIGCVNALKELGLSIPQQVAVVGFDDTMESTMSTPTITTVRQPKYELGRAAMEALIESLDSGVPATGLIQLEYELVIRDSTSVR